jgi:hypothetical protein
LSTIAFFEQWDKPESKRVQLKKKTMLANKSRQNSKMKMCDSNGPDELASLDSKFSATHLTSATDQYGLATGAAAHRTKLLPPDFVLGKNDVICGRGSRCFSHTGNVRFRGIVESRLPHYLNTSCKNGKTKQICEVVNQIREGSPDGGFVKKDNKTGMFYEVGDFLAVS